MDPAGMPFGAFQMAPLDNWNGYWAASEEKCYKTVPNVSSGGYFQIRLQGGCATCQFSLAIILAP